MTTCELDFHDAIVEPLDDIEDDPFKFFDGHASCLHQADNFLSSISSSPSGLTGTIGGMGPGGGFSWVNSISLNEEQLGGALGNDIGGDLVPPLPQPSSSCKHESGQQTKIERALTKPKAGGGVSKESNKNSNKNEDTSKLSEQEKDQLRKQRKREAVRRCRKRKRDHVNQLEARTAKLHVEMSALEACLVNNQSMENNNDDATTVASWLNRNPGVLKDSMQNSCTPSSDQSHANPHQQSYPPGVQSYLAHNPLVLMALHALCSPCASFSTLKHAAVLNGLPVSLLALLQDPHIQSMLSKLHRQVCTRIQNRRHVPEQTSKLPRAENILAQGTASHPSVVPQPMQPTASLHQRHRQSQQLEKHAIADLSNTQSRVPLHKTQTLPSKRGSGSYTISSAPHNHHHGLLGGLDSSVASSHVAAHIATGGTLPPFPLKGHLLSKLLFQMEGVTDRSRHTQPSQILSSLVSKPSEQGHAAVGGQLKLREGLSPSSIMLGSSPPKAQHQGDQIGLLPHACLNELNARCALLKEVGSKLQKLISTPSQLSGQEERANLRQALVAELNCIVSPRCSFRAPAQSQVTRGSGMMADFLLDILGAFPDLKFNDFKVSTPQIHIKPQVSDHADEQGKGNSKSNHLSTGLPPSMGLPMPSTHCVTVKMEWTCRGAQKGSIFGIHVTKDDSQKVSAKVSLTCAWEGGYDRLSSAAPSDRLLSDVQVFWDMGQLMLDMLGVQASR